MQHPISRNWERRFLPEEGQYKKIFGFSFSLVFLVDAEKSKSRCEIVFWRPKRCMRFLLQPSVLFNITVFHCLAVQSKRIHAKYQNTRNGRIKCRPWGWLMFWGGACEVLNILCFSNTNQSLKEMKWNSGGSTTGRAGNLATQENWEAFTSIILCSTLKPLESSRSAEVGIELSLVVICKSNNHSRKVREFECWIM